jgi:acetylornithine/succinyldiaminopimelate/putrescine aminotransferase
LKNLVDLVAVINLTCLCDEHVMCYASHLTHVPFSKISSMHLFFLLQSRYKLTIDSGKGCFLKTTDGKNYLDCVSGIATCALGHNNEFLTKAIENQMKKVHHVSNLYFIPEQAALANWLCTNSGADKAFFCNSGAEANEAAIKVARRHASNRGIEVSLTSNCQRTLILVFCLFFFVKEPTNHHSFGC